MQAEDTYSTNFPLPTELQYFNTTTLDNCEEEFPPLGSQPQLFKSIFPKFRVEDPDSQRRSSKTPRENENKPPNPDSPPPGTRLLGRKATVINSLQPPNMITIKSMEDCSSIKIPEPRIAKSFVESSNKEDDEETEGTEGKKTRPRSDQNYGANVPKINFLESKNEYIPQRRSKFMQLFGSPKAPPSPINMEACKIISDKAVPVEYDRSGTKKRKSKSDLKLRKILHKHANYNDRNASLVFWKVVKLAQQHKTNPFFIIKGKLTAIKNSLIGKKLTFKKVLRHLLTPSEPDQSTRIIWNFIVFLFIIYDMIVLPFMLAFNQETIYSETVTTLLAGIHYGVFISDIILNFNSCYYFEGNLVRDRKEIALHYLKGWFWLDLVTILPYELLTEEDYGSPEENDDTFTHKQIVMLRWAKAIQLLRITKLKTLVSKMRSRIQNSPIRNGLMSLVKLSLVVFFLAHWCACIWYLIGDNLSTTRNWIKEGEFIDNELADKYVAALYFTVTTMITVGYGDLVPVTTRERLFTIFVMILGGGVFGYTMNSIAIILQSLETESSKLRRKFTTACMYMEKQGISQVVQDEVKKYFEFVLDNESTKKQAEKEALMFLPPHLQNKVLEQINKKFVHKNMVLQNNFSQKVLFEIASKVEEKVYSPGETVFDSKDKDPAFFFVAKGTVGVFSEKSPVPFFQVKKSQHFGEFFFFGNGHRTNVAKSINFSHLLFFRRETFVNLLEDFPLDKESFHMIKDKIVLYNDISMLEAKCHVCESTDHAEHNCPSLYYVPNQQETIQKYLETKKEMQRDFQRRARKRVSARSIYQELNEKAKVIQEKLPSPVSDVSLATNDFDEDHFSPFISDIKEDPTSKRSSVKHNKRESTKRENTKRESIKKVVVKGITHTGLEVELYDMMPNMYGTQLSPRDTIFLSKFKEQFLIENFEFDRVKNYEIYFPHNNLSKIIDYKRIDKHRKSNLSEIDQLKKHLGQVFKSFEKK